ncbi:hypothetical protein PUMCH_004036 [Australozyma saopauloensis]|uniref:Zn(2)-C6 fungal-type domain-containing protein n=1 Tax=Australozyma saopauloensis TaxID=291208 RepID=A0AAX4HE35_9ASCO|nr:hypothetical protein PUMCH_004036 [[Candida] saopauloensis]
MSSPNKLGDCEAINNFPTCWPFPYGQGFDPRHGASEFTVHGAISGNLANSHHKESHRTSIWDRLRDISMDRADSRKPQSSLNRFSEACSIAPIREQLQGPDCGLGSLFTENGKELRYFKKVFCDSSLLAASLCGSPRGKFTQQLCTALNQRYTIPSVEMEEESFVKHDSSPLFSVNLPSTCNPNFMGPSVGSLHKLEKQIGDPDDAQNFISMRLLNSNYILDASILEQKSPFPFDVSDSRSIRKDSSCASQGSWRLRPQQYGRIAASPREPSRSILNLQETSTPTLTKILPITESARLFDDDELRTQSSDELDISLDSIRSLRCGHEGPSQLTFKAESSVEQTSTTAKRTARKSVLKPHQGYQSFRRVSRSIAESAINPATDRESEDINSDSESPTNGKFIVKLKFDLIKSRVTVSRYMMMLTCRMKPQRRTYNRKKGPNKGKIRKKQAWEDKKMRQATAASGGIENRANKGGPNEASKATGSNTYSNKPNGCWTCRIRHKACPQDGEICSACVRLHLDCDRSATTPHYIVSREACKQRKKEIKEVTDVYRRIALQAGRKVQVWIRKNGTRRRQKL